MQFGIIAAGNGSRLRSEGYQLPKPLVELEGVPMIGRLIKAMDSCGAESVSVIVNDRMPEVREYLETLKTSAPLHLVVKSTPSSLHSLYELSKTGLGSGARFVATTVDTVFRPEEFLRYVEAFEAAPEEIDGLMGVTTFVDDEKPLYVETSPDGEILAFRDSVWPEARFVSGGIYGLGPASLKVLEGCVEEGVERMRNFQRALIASGMRLKAWEFEKVIDVDHTADLAAAREWLTLNHNNHLTQ